MAHLRTVRTEQAINRCRFYSGRDVYRTSDLSCKGSNALCLLGHGLTTWSEGIVAQHDHECVGDGGPIFYLFGKEPLVRCWYTVPPIFAYPAQTCFIQVERN